MASYCLFQPKLSQSSADKRVVSIGIYGKSFKKDLSCKTTFLFKNSKGLGYFFNYIFSSQKLSTYFIKYVSLFYKVNV